MRKLYKYKDLVGTAEMIIELMISQETLNGLERVDTESKPKENKQ